MLAMPLQAETVRVVRPKEESVALRVSVRVKDDDFPALSVDFVFDSPTARRYGKTILVLRSVSVVADVDLAAVTAKPFTAAPLAPAFLKSEARWSTWTRAARGKALEEVGRAGLTVRGIPRGAVPSGADEKYRRVAQVYRQLVGEGVPNPSAELARFFGISPDLGRTWIARARKRGALGQAAGPLPGEIGDWIDWDEPPAH
jgi:hypothetical protein